MAIHQGNEPINESLRHAPISTRQSAPRPDTELSADLDHPQIVRDLIAQHPGATADDITRMLAEKHIKISSTLVLQELAARAKA